MNISTSDIYYQNGCGESRRLYAVWHPELAIVSVSFYKEEKNDELVFAEDFCLKTATKMRDELTQLISRIESAGTSRHGDSKKINGTLC